MDDVRHLQSGELLKQVPVKCAKALKDAGVITHDDLVTFFRDEQQLQKWCDRLELHSPSAQSDSIFRQARRLWNAANEDYHTRMALNRTAIYYGHPVVQSGRTAARHPAQIPTPQDRWQPIPRGNSVPLASQVTSKTAAARMHDESKAPRQQAAVDFIMEVVHKLGKRSLFWDQTQSPQDYLHFLKIFRVTFVRMELEALQPHISAWRRCEQEQDDEPVAICAVCRLTYLASSGHHAEPMAVGQCCTPCHDWHVIPYRLEWAGEMDNVRHQLQQQREARAMQATADIAHQASSSSHGARYPSRANRESPAPSTTSPPQGNRRRRKRRRRNRHDVE